MGDAADVTVRLGLIGGFALSMSGREVDVADPTRRLLAFLALHRKPQPRALVAGSLWPDKPEDRALANLRSALWALPGARSSPPVHATRHGLQLAPEVRVDLRLVEEEGWAVIEQSQVAPADAALADSPLATDGDLLFEDLLPGWYDDWLLLERERFAELQVHVLDVLVRALTAVGRHSTAINLGLRLVALDPLRERSQLALIDAYLAEGSFGRAERQHRAFCDVLASSVGRGYTRSFADVLVAASGR